ncbi:MAG: protein phosphatase 2C domain-containing protein [Cellvibrio sp.]
MADKTFRRPILWTSAAKTDVGVVRDANEDAIFEKPEIGLWAVADGMGGHLVGDVASGKIVAALDLIEADPILSRYVNTVEDALLDVNEKMIEYAQVMFDEGTMGSTLVSLIIKDRVGVCLWTGDSRLYRFRNQKLQQLTRDHSQLEDMIEFGLLSRENAASYTQKNVITRAIGVESPLYLDVNMFTTQIGDIFILCSDGLYNVVDEQELIDSLASRNVETIAEELIQRALQQGAPDNVSVVVVQGSAGKVQSFDSAQG